MSGIPRKRASLACTNCNRRKLKCDKRMPCARCVARSIQSTCTRAVTGKLCNPRQEVCNTSQVPEHVELQLHESAVTAVPLSQAGHDEANSAATILEFLAWGKRKEVASVTQLSSGEDSHSFSLTDGSSLEYLQLLLPERSMVIKLVDYHVDYLLWYHGSFDRSAFRKGLDVFYEQYRGSLYADGLDLQWAALLFAIIAGSISCGSSAVLVSMGFLEAEQQTLSKRWAHAVTACLNIAQYMAHPSILGCEAIATLTMSAHLLGFSNQQSILLASAIRIAQSLGLHRLRASCKPVTEHERAQGVWDQLCTQDWFSIPFAECYLINPLYSGHHRAQADFEITRVLPPPVPTETGYCRYLHSIALLMPQLQDELTKANTLFTKYEVVVRFDRKMRSLVSAQRPPFLRHGPIDPTWPLWSKWARSAAAISSSHKIIMIHREFLSMSFTNPAFAFTRRTCIAASRTILKEVAAVAVEDGPVLWIFHAFAVAASITLCLDALHLGSADIQRRKHREAVRGTIQILLSATNSTIASRGARMLSDLLAIEEVSSVICTTRRPEDLTDLSIRRRSVSLGDIVRDLQHNVSRYDDDSHMRAESLNSYQGHNARPDEDPYATTNEDRFESAKESSNTGLSLTADLAPANYNNLSTLDGDAFEALLGLAQNYCNS